MTARKPLVNVAGLVRPLHSTDTLLLPAATTANASLNAPHGTAPTSPVDGDVWTTTDGVFAQIDGVTVGPLLDTTTAPLVIGFILNTGATGTNVGPELIASRAGSFTKCKVVTKASHASTDLTFTINQNGVAIFSSAPTVAHGTSAGTISTFTGLTSSPLSVAADDLFTIDISSGSATWAATVQLE